MPFAAEDATEKTELTVVNPGDETATATLTLHGSDGSVLGTGTVTLPAKTLTRQTLAGVFPGASLETTSHVVVQGDRALVAHEIVANFQVAVPTFRRETIAVGGRTPTGSTRQILPQFVTGAGWLSFLGLVNTAATSQDVVLTARMDDGTAWDLPENPKTVTLGANGGWRGTVAELFGITDGAAQFRAGWIDIATPVGFLTSYIGFGNEATASFALVGGVDDTAASKLQVYSQVAEGGLLFTGLTVANPSMSEATIEFFTLRPDGTTVGKSTLTVPANGRVGRLYRELLPAALGQVGGWAYLRSSVEVVGAVLFGGTNGFALANVPAEAISTDFIPPAQVAAAITGTVRQDGVGVDDVTVSLTGPVATTTTTDAEGRYIFGQLPAGTYTLSATRLGAQVVPAERTVELGLENVTDEDFTAGGVVASDAPSLSFITPSSTFVGTALTNLKIIGTNFTPSTVIEFNGTALQTSFVSSVELAAVIASSSPTQVGAAEITVRTPPPGGGTSMPAAFVVIAVPDNPLIEGRVTVGSFPAGVAIHPTRKIALVTNESSDNVSVIDLEAQEVVETIAVGRSPGEGIDIHAGRDLAVVANVGSDNVSVIDLETMEVTATLDVGRFPVGVAIDETRELAVVTNGEDGNVSLIHLPTPEVVFEVAVGDRPAGVAIHSGLGIAVVANRGNDNVSLIDLDARTNVATIPVEGGFPRGVSIHEGKNLAVVANASSNTISLIDLGSRQLIRNLDVGTAPTGVGIHELTSHAVVSNSGLVRGSTDLGGLTTVSIVDLEGEELVEDVPVGSAAFGVDVDEASQMAVVANFGSNDVTLIRVPFATPRLTDVQPKTLPPGAVEHEITVTGTGFAPISVVTLNGQPLPTTFVSTTELRAILSGELLEQLLQVSSISADDAQPVRFDATAPLVFGVVTGDKVSEPPADPLATRILTLPTGVSLFTMEPTEGEVGTSTSLTLRGQGITGNTIVHFGGLELPGSETSATEMTVDIPGSALSEPGDVAVFLENPAVVVDGQSLGGGTSQSLTFKIAAPQPKVENPVIESVSPSSVFVGSRSVVLNVSGGGFAPGITEVTLGGRTLDATVTEDSIEASVPDELFETAGTLSGLLDSLGKTASFSISVVPQAPSISGIDPIEAPAGGDSVAVTVTGEHFTPDTMITVDGTRISTDFGDATTVTGTIPGAFTRLPGSLTIGVIVPLGGEAVAVQPLVIRNPAPVADGLEPSEASLAEFPIRVTVTGRNFVRASMVHVDGSPVDTTYLNTTSLAFDLTRGPGIQTLLSVDGGSIPSFLAVSGAGTLSVTVVTPEPGGGTSDAVTFTIRDLVPKIDAADPDTVPFNSSASTTITLTGSGFKADSVVELDGSPVASVFVDANTLTFDLAAGTAAGDHDVTVTNQVTSNSVSLRVTARPPIVSSVQPDRGVAGENHSVEVNGENFIEGADVLVDGQPGGGRFNGSTSMSVTLPPAPAGTRSISVKNPDGAESNAVDFTDFEAPAPTVRIVSVTPDPSTAKAGQLLTIILEGFGDTTQLVLDDRPLTFTQLDTRTVTIVAPAFADGEHILKAINVATAAGGGGTSTYSFTTGTVAFVPNEILVFNDVDIFDSEGMDDDYEESPGGANPNNKLLARNLVSFTSSGSRNSGTVVQFDCGRSSGYSSACTSETDLMKAEFTSAGLTTTVVNSTSRSMTSIPSNVKVLFLWLPRVIFTGVEINTMKQFVADGGRIVFVGEQAGTYDSISTVANVFLKDMGTKSLIKGGSFDNTVTTLPAASLNTTGHQVMTGLTGLEHAIASEINPLDSQDTFLFKERDDSNITQAGTAVLAAALKVTTDSIPTAVPTLTSVSPTNPVAGQSVVMTLTGTNFTPGSTVTLAGGLEISVTVTNVEFVSSTTLKVTISITSGHSGPYTFKVTTANGQSGTAGFTIVNDMATVTSVTPNSGIQGAIVPVTITGNQFTSAQSVNPSAGIIVLSFTVNSNTEISAVLRLTASSGGKFISVTNSAGAVNSVAFTINASSITSASSLVISSLAGSQGFGTEDGTGSAAAFNTPNGTAVYNNNIYVADFANHTIRQIVIATGVVTTLAGSAGNSGTTDGTGPAARLNGPTGVVSDGTGNLFVTDQFNHTIRKIVVATGVVTTLAGSAGSSGMTDGTGTGALFNLPFGISCCGSSPPSLYVTDSGNHSIREVVISSGVVTTPVGVAGTPGFVDADDNLAKLNTPKGLVEASGDVLFVADSGNNVIRKVTTGGTHTVTTFAGPASGVSGSADGTSTAARFNGPVGIATDATNLYVGDRLNHTIRKIQMSNQAVTTFAGTAGTSGFVGGSTASNVRSNQPGFLSISGGTLYVSDEKNHAIRKTDLGEGFNFSTLAGSPNPKSGSVDATGSAARLNFPQGAAIDAAGNIYVSDTNNHVIRKVASGTGAVTTLAGSSGTAGTADGTGTGAQFNLPESGVVVGNFLYVADVGNHTIRKVNVTTGVVTTFAGQAGTSGSADGTGTGATFSSAHAIASDGTSLFVADKDNHTIRKIVLSTAVVSTFAGSAGSNGFTNATATAARFDLPLGITATSTTVYVSEGNNHAIRAITISSGAVTTLAGAGTSGSTDATGASAKFNFPHGITTDGDNVYVADRDNHVIRKVVISSGVVTTIAGSAPTSGFVNSSGTSARFNSPMDIVGNGTNLFIIDGLNHQVRKGAELPQ